MGKQGPLSNPAAQGKMRELEKLRRADREADIRAVMSHPYGRRFVMDVIERRACAFATAFTGQNDFTNFNEGRRAVGLELMQDIQRITPERYVEALVEQRNQATADERTKAQAEAEENTDE